MSMSNPRVAARAAVLVCTWTCQSSARVIGLAIVVCHGRGKELQLLELDDRALARQSNTGTQLQYHATACAGTHFYN